MRTPKGFANDGEALIMLRCGKTKKPCPIRKGSQEGDRGPACLCILPTGHLTGFTGVEREHQDFSLALSELFFTQTRKSRVERTEAQHGDPPQSQT